MDTEFFSQRVNAFRKRIASLFEFLQNPNYEQKAILQESFIELAKALEEMETAEEELKVQAAELEQFRQQAEVEHNKYLEILRFCPDGYLMTDLNGVIRLANPAACQMLHKNMEYLLGKPLINWIAESDRKMFQRQLTRMLTDGAVENFEMRVSLRKQPTQPVFSFTAGPVRSPLGEARAIHWLIRDVTQAHQAQQAQSPQGGRFHTIFVTAPNGIQLLDRNSFTLDANPAAQRLLGYNQEELQHMSFVDYIHPEDLEKLVTFYSRLSHREIDRFRMEVKLLTKKRGALHVRVSIARYMNPNDPAGFATVAIEELSEQNGSGPKSTEARANSHKSSLLLRQSMAQELKSGPLEDLVGILHRLENIAQPDQDQIGDLEEIRMALQYTIATMTDKINDMASNGSIPFDLREAITALTEQLQVEHASLTCTIDYDPGLNAVPEATRLALFNIFSEITQYRVRQLRPSWLEVHAQRSQDTATLEIQDDGPGEKLLAQPETLIREGQFEYAEAIEQAEALHGHISSDGAVNGWSTIRIVIPLKNAQAKDSNGPYRKTNRGEQIHKNQVNNKTTGDKLGNDGPVDLPNNQQVFYIPHSEDENSN